MKGIEKIVHRGAGRKMVKWWAVLIGIALFIGFLILACNTQMVTSHIPTPAQGQNGLFDWVGSFSGYILAFILLILSGIFFWHSLK